MINIALVWQCCVSSTSVFVFTSLINIVCLLPHAVIVYLK